MEMLNKEEREKIAKGILKGLLNRDVSLEYVLFGYFRYCLFKGKFFTHLLCLLEYLDEKGFDINIQDDEGNTILHYYYKVGLVRKEVVDSLIEFGADENIKNNKGLTPLEFGFDLDIDPSKIIVDITYNPYNL